MTGGSHAEARVSTPPRLGGLALAAIQSGCGDAAASARPRLAPTARAAAPPTAVRLTKSRRVRGVRRDAGRGSVAAIGTLLPSLSASVQRRETTEPERT